MKTIEEALNIAYEESKSNAYFGNGFKKGVEFAQRFISVNDELPEDTETDGRIHIPCIVTNGQTKTIAFRRLSPLTKKWNWNVMLEVTHWRPIELK